MPSPSISWPAASSATKSDAARPRSTVQRSSSRALARRCAPWASMSASTAARTSGTRASGLRVTRRAPYSRATTTLIGGASPLAPVGVRGAVGGGAVGRTAVRLRSLGGIRGLCRLCCFGIGGGSLVALPCGEHDRPDDLLFLLGEALCYLLECQILDEFLLFGLRGGRLPCARSGLPLVFARTPALHEIGHRSGPRTLDQ